MAYVARDDTDNTVENNDWMGWCELNEASVTIENGNLVSRSRHTFEFENHMNAQKSWEIEYQHHLRRHLGGNSYEELGSAKESDSFPVAAHANFGHADVGWNNTRTISIPVPAAGSQTYLLQTYTAVRPEDGQQPAAIQAGGEYEFTVG